MDLRLSSLSKKESKNIALSVGKGNLKGRVRDLYWTLQLKDRKTIFFIANLIARGYTNGFFPAWQLVFHEKKTEGKCLYAQKNNRKDN